MMKRILAIILIVYGMGYLGLRTFSSDVWEEDGQTYILYPQSPIAIYYAYRPLSYIDGFLTGIRSHIGPHQ